MYYDLIDDLFTLFLDFFTSLLTSNGEEADKYTLTKKIVLFITRLGEEKSNFMTRAASAYREAQSSGMNLLIDRVTDSYVRPGIARIPVEGKTRLNRQFAVAFGIESWDYSEEYREYDKLSDEDYSFIKAMRKSWEDRSFVPEVMINTLLNSSGRIPLIKEVRTVAFLIRDSKTSTDEEKNVALPYMSLCEAKDFVQRMTYVEDQYVEVPNYALQNFLQKSASLDY